MNIPTIYNIHKCELDDPQLLELCTQYPEVEELFNKVLNNKKNLVHLCRCIFAFKKHNLEIPSKLLQTLNKLDNAGLLMEEFFPLSVTEALINQQLKIKEKE